MRVVVDIRNTASFTNVHSSLIIDQNFNPPLNRKFHWTSYWRIRCLKVDLNFNESLNFHGRSCSLYVKTLKVTTAIKNFSQKVHFPKVLYYWMKSWQCNINSSRTNGFLKLLHRPWHLCETNHVKNYSNR